MACNPTISLNTVINLQDNSGGNALSDSRLNSYAKSDAGRATMTALAYAALAGPSETVDMHGHGCENRNHGF